MTSAVEANCIIEGAVSLTCTCKELHQRQADIAYKEEYFAIMAESTNSTEGGGYFSWLPSWKPTSFQQLEEAEAAILSGIDSKYESKFVSIGNGLQIRTFIFKTSTQFENHPLVMMHGFGAASLCFHKNLASLSRDRTVIIFDLPGFGRSSRLRFSTEPKTIEEEFIDAIERWRAEMGLDQFILAGHSLGAFLATCYTIRYPSHVHHLVLVDPWGFERGPSPEEMEEAVKELPDGIRLAIKIDKVVNFYPFTIMRAAGPLGRKLFHYSRPDLVESLGEQCMNYLYHCNAQTPSGEAGYYYLQQLYGWAKHPLVNRIDQLQDRIGITLVTGSWSWLSNRSTGEKIQACRPNSYLAMHSVSRAGHHLYADNSDVFNAVISSLCTVVDSGGDQGPNESCIVIHW